MEKRFLDKSVLVTGAAGGLGRAYALGFAAEGARLIIADIDAAGLAETADMLRGLGAPVDVHRIDLANEDEIHRLGAAICSGHEKLDVLMNNAGLAYGEVAYGFVELSQAKWLHFFAVNSIAPLLLAQAVRPSLARAEGIVINQSSMASHAPATAYGVTKATLNALTYGMANNFAGDRIRVNAILPGMIPTPASTAGLPEGTMDRIQAMQLIPMQGELGDMVNLALFLASKEGRFINCELINSDGGSRLRGWF